MSFHFRQFDVEDEHSTMRVGTDAMLLGAWSAPGRAAKILDIGTGCGVLALMMAQKTIANIVAIDIDHSSVSEAQGNFYRSPWSDRLIVIYSSLGDFTPGVKQGFDFILSNPPWFSNSLKSPSVRKNIARHDQSLPGEELIQSVVRILAPDGSFALVLPADISETFIVTGKSAGLYVQRRLQVYPKPGTPPLRTLVEFGRKQTDDPYNEKLTILDEKGTFSPEYLALTHDFHNF